MAEEPFEGTIEQAMAFAIEEAMDCAGPREQTLLALARHALSSVAPTAQVERRPAP
jgi:hypothetical protein